jgi:hypothetical protein
MGLGSHSFFLFVEYILTHTFLWIAGGLFLPSIYIKNDHSVGGEKN